MEHFLLGSDPELTLVDSATGKLRSAIPIIPDGKGAGVHLDNTGENKAIHDNVLVEFNTKPAESKAEFVQTIGTTLRNLEQYVRPFGVKLHLQSYMKFPASELACDEARIFGCDPDFGVYPPEMNEMPAEAAFKPYRSCGGHLHIGKLKGNTKLNNLLDDPYGKVNVVKALDIFVGIVGTLLDLDPTAKQRKQLYGKAGAHRPKEYGVEYRACGPWWLAGPEYTEAVYSLTADALRNVVNPDFLPQMTVNLGGEDKIQAMVNNSDSRACKAALKHFKHHLSPESIKAVSTLRRKKVLKFRQNWKLD